LARITECLLRIGKENRLRVVAKHGIGVDNVDIEAAKRLGIRVVYTPSVMANAVAEFTLGAILLMAKNYMKYDSEVRKGGWKMRYYANNLEIRGKTIGLIGHGHIGRMVAKLANCFGAHVVVYDPYVRVQEEYVKQEDLYTLLRISDFISVHAPLRKETYHMIGRKKTRNRKRWRVADQYCKRRDHRRGVALRSHGEKQDRGCCAGYHRERAYHTRKSNFKM